MSDPKVANNQDDTINVNGANHLIPQLPKNTEQAIHDSINNVDKVLDRGNPKNPNELVLEQERLIALARQREEEKRKNQEHEHEVEEKLLEVGERAREHDHELHPDHEIHALGVTLNEHRVVHVEGHAGANHPNTSSIPVVKKTVAPERS